MLGIVIIKLKSFLLVIFLLFQRAMCCFRRRRRYSGDVEPLTHVVTNQKDGDASEADNWNDWRFMNKAPSSVQDHIEIYRQQQQIVLRQKSMDDPPVTAEDADFFQDMTPKITQQQKVLIPDEASSDCGHSGSISLQLKADAILSSSKSLEDWNEKSGWDGEDMDTDAQELLREKRRQERERKNLEQQLRRQEKMSRQGVGVKRT